MVRNASGPSTTRIEGLEFWLAATRELHGYAKRDFNTQMRDYAGTIARALLPDAIAAMRRSPAPQAEAVADTARVKRDRVPAITFGMVKPKLSGFTKRHPGNRKASASVAWGAEYGPLGGHRSGPRQGANFYGVARNTSGYGVTPVTREGGSVFAEATAEFEQVLTEQLRRMHLI